MEFDQWLSEKLQSIKLDDEMFLDYLKGVLVSDDTTEDDKLEELKGILSGAVEESVDSHCVEIIRKWTICCKSSSDSGKQEKSNETSNDRIKSIIEKQQSTVSQPKRTQTNSDYSKDELLARYAHISDEEQFDSDEDGSKLSHSSKEDILFRNENAKCVFDKQKAEREKQKKEHEDKKVRDKQNREAEKLKRQERQEKEKKRTQKGEKRR